MVTVERLLLCLDEQGLVISSPWPQRDDPLITAELWPQMWAAWTVTAEKHSSVVSWLQAPNSQPITTSVPGPLAHAFPPSPLSCDGTSWQSEMCTAYYGVLPPCIRGRQAALLGAQIEMECLPDDAG